MADKKEFKIGSSFDAKGLTQLTKSLKDLSKQLEILNGPKGLKGLVSAMKELNQSIRGLSQISQAVRGVQQLGQAFGQAAQQAQKASQAYGQFSNVANGKMGVNAYNSFSNRNIRASQAQQWGNAGSLYNSGLNSYKVNPADFGLPSGPNTLGIANGGYGMQQYNNYSGYGGGPPRHKNSGWWNSESNPYFNNKGPSRMEKWGGYLAGAAGVSSGVGTFANYYQSQKTQIAQNAAGVRDYERTLLNEMAGGDFSRLYFMTRRTNTGGERGLLGRNTDRRPGVLAGQGALDEFGGTLSPAISLGSNVASGLLGSMGAGALVGGAVGSVTGPGAIPAALGGAALAGVGHIASNMHSNMQNLAAGKPEMDEVHSVLQGQNAQMMQDPYTMKALEHLQQTASMRVAGAKHLQGRHMGAWGIGAGYGLDMGESMSAASSLANQFGVGMTMGSGGRMVNGMSQAEIFKMQNSKYESKIAAMTKTGRGLMQGYQPSDLAKMNATGEAVSETEAVRKSRMRMEGGKMSLMGATLDFERTGFDRGSAGHMLGTMSNANGGDVSKAKRDLEDIFSKGINRGLTEGKFHEKIGEAVANSSIGQGGALTNTLTYGNMLMNGLNGNSTMRDVQGNIGGVEAFNQLMNGNQYFNLTKTSIARQVLGENGTGLQMQALQQADLGELVTGSQRLDALGVGKNKRSDIAKNWINSVGTSLINPNDSSISDLGGAMKKGQSLWDILKDTKGDVKDKRFQQFAAVMNTTGTMDWDKAVGFGRLAGGIDENVTADKNPSKLTKFGDGMAESTVITQQKILMDLYEREIKIRKEYLAALEVAPDAAKNMEKDQDPNFQTFQIFIKELISAIQTVMTKSKTR